MRTCFSQHSFLVATAKESVGEALIPLLFFCFFLLSGVAPSRAAVDSAPFFTGGLRQSLSLCEGTSFVALNSILSVMDTDAGQTENWFVSQAPVSGTLSGFASSTTSTGAILSPVGLGYSPLSGFSGVDSFVIGITDGIDTAYTTVVYQIYPFPVLTSSTSAGYLCSGSVFNYTPTGTAGAVFNWVRPYVPGIGNPSGSGIGNPNEVLNNITYYDEPVTYNYSITANGCMGTASVTVTVHPIPAIVSPLVDTICSSSTLVYAPTSLVAGTTYSWSRAAVAGISPATASSGIGTIREVLVSDTTDTAVVVYVISASANGCSITRNLSVAVIPQGAVTGITTKAPDTLCMGAQFQNYGAGVLPPAGMTYAWSAVNANLWAVGSTTQYALVSFPDTGAASVILSITGGPSHCTIFDTAKVYVRDYAAFSGSVIYYNFQFIFRDNTQSSYQWGYDNVYTLDSTLIPGATFQSYPILSPDFVDNYYWVITTKDGCLQKTYFNNPLQVTNAIQQPVEVTLAPNPASDRVRLSNSGALAGKMQWVITDVTGREIFRTVALNQDTDIDVSGWNGGCYFVVLQGEGVSLQARKLVIAR